MLIQAHWRFAGVFSLALLRYRPVSWLPLSVPPYTLPSPTAAHFAPAPHPVLRLGLLVSLAGSTQYPMCLTPWKARAFCVTVWKVARDLRLV